MRTLALLLLLSLPTLSQAADFNTTPMVVLGMPGRPRCSGWRVSPRQPDGGVFVVTAFHCNRKHPLVRLDSRAKPISFVSGLRIAEKNDVLLLRYSTVTGPDHYPISDKLPGYGDAILGIGYATINRKGIPRYPFMVIPGVYMGQKFIDVTDEILTAWMPIQGGMSGGAVSHKDGMFAIMSFRFPGGMAGISDVRWVPDTIKAFNWCVRHKGVWDYEKASCTSDGS